MNKSLFEESFVDRNLKICKEADENILGFIDRIKSFAPRPENIGDADKEIEQAERVIHNLFRNSYCWYFAHMIDMAFPELEGEVCWTAPFGHFVYMFDNVPYDIEGVYKGEAEYFIPEEFLGDAIEDFMHAPDKGYNATKEDIQGIIDDYLAYQDNLSLSETNCLKSGGKDSGPDEDEWDEEMEERAE